MVQLKKIDWIKAINNLESTITKKEDAFLVHHLANCYSLSALYLTDYSVALKNIQHAKSLTPFNPIHQYRLILMFFHFGQWEQGRQLLDQLEEKLPNTVLLKYLKSLSALRLRGLEKRAGIIAKDIDRQNKNFKWASFLSVESALRIRFKKGVLEKGFRTLPKEVSFQASWLDLYIKIIILYGQEGIKFVQANIKMLKPFEKGQHNKVEELLQQVIEWSSASAEVFRKQLTDIPPDTKIEQMALICHFSINKRKKNTSQYLRQAQQLYRAFPERSAVKRLYTVNLNQVAVEKASKGNLTESLAILEICQKLEPYNLIHWQNKATIFTLLRETSSYYESWKILDRYHFRLALLGQLSQNKVKRLAQRFRMFAQQARLTPSTEENDFQLNFGILKPEIRVENNIQEKIITINQLLIDSDPDQLRQWLHFSAAELVFLHLSLGTNPANYLLGYPDELLGKAKINSLVQLSSALEVLVKEEGALLQKEVTDMWMKQWKNRHNAQAVSTSPEIEFVQQTHLETFADAALLLHLWEPKADQEYMVNELIDFFKAECMFLDAKLLFQDKKAPVPYPIIQLQRTVNFVLKLDKPKKAFSLAELTQLSNYFCSGLLINFSIGTYEQLKFNAKSAARKAIQILEKAQKIDDQSPRIEYFRAEFFLIGGFYEESKKAIARFYQLVPDKENAFVENIEKIQEALEEAEGKGQKYAPIVDQTNASQEKDESNLNELIKAIDNFPTSTQAYEQIVYFLVRNGAYEAALGWTKKALARCLSRQGQLKSRLLNMEVEAFRLIKINYQEEINFYTKGIHSSLQKILKKVRVAEESEYLIDFLLGQCFLKDRNSKQASQYYQSALKNCNKQLYHGVLKVLATDVEKAMLAATQKTVTEAITGKAFERAFSIIAELMGQIKQPEKGLLLLANSILKAIIHHSEDLRKIPRIPTINILANWNVDWLKVISQEHAIDILKGVLQLSIKHNASDKEQNKKIQTQIEEIENQRAITTGITNINKLSEEGLYEKALLELKKLEHLQIPDALLQRQKITLLLKLNRFEEADLLWQKFNSEAEDTNQSFIKNYETLKFRQVMLHVQHLLRAGNYKIALPLLNTITPSTSTEKMDLAYCKAFGISIKAYQKKRDNQKSEMVALIADAIDEIEPFVDQAELQNRSHLEALYDKLTKDLHDLKSKTYGK